MRLVSRTDRPGDEFAQPVAGLRAVTERRVQRQNGTVSESRILDWYLEGGMDRPGGTNLQTASNFPGDVRLRDTTADDLGILFEQQADPEWVHMAAFTAKDPSDRDAFMEHWAKVLADPSNVNRTILVDGRVAGSIACFEMFGERTVGYGLGREYWGHGIATRALALFLDVVAERPLYARVVKDNVGSRRVLQKCGFTICGEDKGFANARNAEVEEHILMLPGNESDDSQRAGGNG
jgi:RimJ/RimL family protein N-acetyltransferase